MIRLHALSSAEIQTPQLTITPSQEIVFAATLYLILEGERPVSRQKLASLLWPLSETTVRAHRLRQTLFQLKRLGIGLDATRDTIRLAPRSALIDADSEPPAGIASTTWPSRIDILSGYDPTFSPPYAEWVDSARERMQVRLLERLIPLLENARASGDWIHANRLASYCLDLDPFNESALLTRAEGLAMRGQKNAALDVLDRYMEEVTPRNAQLAIPAKILRNRVAKHTTPTMAHLLTREPSWVGRHSEMLFLTTQLSNALDCRGTACVVRGDAGIGKTRMASELGKFAALQGIRVERVACRKPEETQPLSAFVTLVSRLRELPGALGADQESLLALRRLTDINAGSSPASDLKEDTRSVYINLRSAIFDLLDAVSEEKPLLVIVDDIQWLDSASARLFATMLDWLSTRRVFLLLNSRTKSKVEEYATPGLLSTIHLDPLAETDARAVAAEVVAFSGTQITPAEVDWLIRTSDGNPYFLLELTKHWIETGRPNEVPPSVVQVLRERISRISERGRQLLQACAILGENANLERLEQVLEVPAHELLGALEEIATAGMVRLGTSLDSAPKILQVRHDLLANAALSTMNAASIVFLHRRCGVVLEREVLGPTISVSLLRACAFHWRQAGDANRAYELSTKCARYLLEIGLAADASAALEGVLAFCSTNDQQTEVLERIAEAHWMARNSEALLNTVARIRALQGGERRTTYHDNLEITEFEVRRISEREIAPVFSRTLSCIYDRHLAPLHRVSAAVVALKLATALGDLQEIERIYLEIKPFLSENSIDARSRLQVQVVYHTMVGDLTAAGSFAKERIAMERRSGSWLQLTNAISDLAYVLRRSGPPEEIHNVLAEAYEIAIARKLFAAASDYAERLAECMIDTDRALAELWLNRATQSHLESDQMQTAFSVGVVRTRLALWDGRLDDADRLINAFRWDWLGDRHKCRAAALALRVRTHIARRHSVDCVFSDVNELRSLYERIARLGGEDYEISSLCSGLIYIGDQAAARTHLHDYVSSKRRERTPFSQELSEICSALPDSSLTNLIGRG